MGLSYVVCPRCMEHSVPKGGVSCELCGWQKKGSAKVASEDPVKAPTAEQKPEVAAEKAPGQKPKKKKHQTFRACAECGAEKRIISRGLCGACYPRLKKAGTLDELYPAKTQKKKAASPAKGEDHLPAATKMIDQESLIDSEPNRVPAAESVLVEMSQRDLELFEQLKRWAEDERRSIPGQILHILDKVVPGRMKGIV